MQVSYFVPDYHFSDFEKAVSTVIADDESCRLAFFKPKPSANPLQVGLTHVVIDYDFPADLIQLGVAFSNFCSASVVDMLEAELKDLEG